MLVGGEHRVKLRGLGDAGYSWSFSVEGQPGVVEVARRSEDEEKPPKELASFSVNPVYVIRCLKPGKATVTFSLSRVWEKDKPPIETVVYQVEAAG